MGESTGEWNFSKGGGGDVQIFGWWGGVPHPPVDETLMYSSSNSVVRVNNTVRDKFDV